MTESWNGTAWAVQPVPPLGEPATSTLTSVSCVSATSCTAVGSAVASELQSGPPFEIMAVTWNGMAWSLMPAPSPTNIPLEPSAISCVTASLCMITGQQQPNGNYQQPLGELWDGTNWTEQTVPPLGDTGELNSVSCTTATSCTAVGQYTDFSSTGSAAEVARWNGST